MRPEPEAVMIQADPGIAVVGHTYRPEAHADFFVREESRIIKALRNPVIILRPGVVVQGDVVLVMLLFRIGSRVYETWWNYYEEGSDDLFKEMAKQETIGFHLYGETGKREKSTVVKNPLKGLFKELVKEVKKKDRWSQAEFERAKEQLFHRYPTAVELWEELGRQTET
jgi:hypothetical protein